MFLIDDLLLLPAKEFIGIVKKIRDMALEELEDTPEKLKRELLDLQMEDIETFRELDNQYKQLLHIKGLCSTYTQILLIDLIFKDFLKRKAL